MPQPVVQDPLVAKVKRLIVRKGGETGIRGLSRCFRVHDDDGDHQLSRAEFVECLEDFGIDLNASDVDKLMAAFDTNNDGKIGITEFLTAFRVGLNPKRKAYIQRVFQHFDQNGDGRLTLDEFRRGYNASGHPDVLSGKSTEEEVLDQFYKSFDDQTNPDGVISKQEFEQQYSGISATIGDDDAFIALVASTWNLDTKLGGTVSQWGATTTMDPQLGTAHATLNASLQSINPATHTIAEREAAVAHVLSREKALEVTAKMRQLAREKIPTKYYGLARELKKGDAEGRGFVDPGHLAVALRAVKLHYFISEDEMNLITTEYDTRKNGTLDYMALVNAVTGDIHPRRLMLLERTWKKFKRNAKGEVVVEDLIANYVPDMIPDVARGLMTKGEALSGFLDSWDATHHPTGLCTFADFEAYYTAVSEGVPSHNHFDTMIKVSWKVWAEDASRLVAALLT